MTNNGRYNGWANYPTWAVNLWLSNDELSERDMQRLAREHRGDADMLADAIREYCESGCEDAVPAGMAADLLGWVWDQVDWHELADAYLEDVAEDDA